MSLYLTVTNWFLYFRTPDFELYSYRFSSLVISTEVKIGTPKHGSKNKIQYSTIGLSKPKLIIIAPSTMTNAINPKKVLKNFAGMRIPLKVYGFNLVYTFNFNNLLNED